MFEGVAMKKIFSLVLLLFVVIASAASVEGTTIARLNYKESAFSALPGNLTLVFHNSTNNNESDIEVVSIPNNNWTIVSITSKTIIPIWNFVNDTKEYVFKSGSSFYTVYVDYSSISSPYIEYFKLLEEKNATIVELESKLQNTTFNETVYNDLISQIQTLKQYKNETSVVLASYEALKVEVSGKNSTIDVLKNEKTSLLNEINSLTDSVDGLTNVFSITYPRGDVDVFHFSASWFFIGGIAFLFIFFFFTKKSGMFKLPTKHSRVEEPVVYDVRDERPDVEEGVLREFPKATKKKDISKDVDRIIRDREVENILRKKW